MEAHTTLAVRDTLDARDKLEARDISCEDHLVSSKELNTQSGPSSFMIPLKAVFTYRELSEIFFPSKVHSISGSGSPDTTQSMCAVFPSSTSTSTNFSSNFGAAVETNNKPLYLHIKHGT